MFVNEEPNAQKGPRVPLRKKVGRDLSYWLGPGLLENWVVKNRM